MTSSATVALATFRTTPEEARALSAWSAYFLPLCRNWLQRRDVRPPSQVIAEFQMTRFGLQSWTLEDLATLLNQSRECAGEKTASSGLARITHDLAEDFVTYQRYISRTIHVAPREQAIPEQLARTRDLHRFQRVMGYLAPGELWLTHTPNVLIPAFSPRKRALYLPDWLMNDLPRLAFQATAALAIPRQTSLLWLLLEAIVLPSGERFQTL